MRISIGSQAACLAVLAFALLISGCQQQSSSLSGDAHNRFETEFELEERALTLVKEARAGDYGLTSTTELKEVLDAGGDLLVVDTTGYDASYANEHVPGAVNFTFPVQSMDEWDRKVMKGKTAEQFQEVLGEDKDRLIIFYCGFLKCTSSHNAAAWARKLGYTNVNRYPGGIDAWKGAGFATEAVAQEK
jgi:rhodanese-related sulfurtransferase